VRLEATKLVRDALAPSYRFAKMSSPYTSPVHSSVSAGAPVVRQISWLAVAIQLGVLLGFIILLRSFTRSSEAFVCAAVAYLTYSLASRFLIAAAHRRGIRLSRSGRYYEALQAYDQSLQFFSRHPWIDRFRAITLLSASAMSYREMALCNIAFCRAQLGERTQAKEIYRRVLEEFPDNSLAIVSLRMIECGEQANVDAGH
jgi:tetratricopeptide (TPR) repeat protein